ncbi:MAG: hypothetical protein N3E40_06740 [Dehalococcoidia bacterium]|nr:hypothetical protein [Dehalococcoidia bacterium]
MSRLTITLDEQQIARLEQVVIDDDAEGALKFVREMHLKLEDEKRRKCDPVRLRASTTIQSITGKKEG